MIFIYYAIKKHVFENKEVTMAQLKEALANKDMRFAEYIEKTSNHF